MKIKNKSQQNKIDYLESTLWRETLRQKEEEIVANYQSVGSKDSNQDFIVDLDKDDQILHIHSPYLSSIDSNDEDTSEFESRLVLFDHHNSVSLLSNFDNETNSNLLSRS